MRRQHCLVPLAILCTTILAGRFAHAEQATMWIGTATSPRGDSRGIYRVTLDLDSGQMSTPELAAEIGSPGFVTVSRDGQRLYAVCDRPEGGGPGVAAFRVYIGDDPFGEDRDGPFTGDVDEGERYRLSFINSQPIGDGGAAHLATDATEKCLFTAQYGSGSVAVFPLDDEGAIGPRSDLVKHEGSGPNRSRQEGPHPHWVGVDPANEFLFVPDLGIDQVVVYRMDLENGTIERHGAGQAPAGGGPRHMKFSTDGRFAYLVNELGPALTVFQHDSGALEPIQTISMLPNELREVPNTGSEVRIHPSGKFVYAANRGNDSIAVFRVDEETGKLTFVELEAIRGSWPRNFNIDPTGRWLIAAGRHSNTLTAFRIDEETGGLVFAGQTVNCPSPICVEFQAMGAE